MKPSSLYFMLVLLCLGVAPAVQARDVVVPAGTLMTCTLDEPKFSSATVSVGDPFLCYPRTMQQFGQIVFPRGTYMVGHLEADQEPGHFVGKGYLKLAFDRIGLPEGDIPLTAKVIAVAGFNVNKEGKVIGHGHATRDTVEWMLPPLWPWKILTLPAKGPRPTLKGEVRVTLRVMDDIFVPSFTTPGWHRFGEPSSYPMPRQSSQLTQPRAVAAVSYQPAVTAVPAAASSISLVDPAMSTISVGQQQPITTQAVITRAVAVSPAPMAAETAQLSPRNAWAPNVTLFALADGTVFPATAYWRDQDQLWYMSDGDKGTIALHDIDWSATTKLNAARSVRVVLRNAPTEN